MTYVNTHNIKITATKLVSNLFCFHADSSLLLLNSWHSASHAPRATVTRNMRADVCKTKAAQLTSSSVRLFVSI